MHFPVFRRLPDLQHIDYRAVLFALALYFCVAFNWTVLGDFYSILGALDAYDPIFAATAPLVIFLGLILVFIPFSFKPVLKPFFTVLILTSAPVTYGMVRYGIVFDRDMIRNFAETNAAEAFSYLTPMAVFWFVMTGLLPAILLVLTPVRYATSFYRGIGQRIVMTAIIILCIGTIAAGYFKDYASVGRNNKILGKEIVPISYITGTIRYVKGVYRDRSIPFRTIGNDARLVRKTDKPTLMFLVIGETGRAASLAANGYDRPTTPFTEKLGTVIAFQNVRSCGTATAISVPCMFSQMSRSNYDESVARNSENLLDGIAKAGIPVLWMENDGGCKGVCDRVPTVEISTDDFPDLCQNGTCHDEAFLEKIDQEILDMGKGDKLIVMHLIGSHGPTYFERYPENFRQFTPDCPRKDIENCTQQELVNTYDNTIRYTDFVISQMIEKLTEYDDAYNPALLYLSDHGESLGESGLYLHGAPYIFAPEEQTHIPMMAWMSAAFASTRHIDRDCINTISKENSYSQDNLFSTVLGLMQVETSIYDQKSDIFASCENGKDLVHADR